MQTATVAGRELPMAFDVRAWVEDLEPRFGDVSAMVEEIGGRDKPITAGVDMLVLVVNAGFRSRGSKERITRDWLMDNLEPGQTPKLIGDGQTAIFRAFAQEEKTEEDQVDEVLAELAKKEPGSA